VRKDPLELTVTDLEGHVIAEDCPAGPSSTTARPSASSASRRPTSNYFGLGDKPGPLDRRNEAFVDWNTDAFGWQESTDPIYKSIPFFITYRKGIAAGTFLDNTWRAGFDFNKELPRRLLVRSRAVRWTTTFFTGPEPKAVVEAWAWLVGTTPLPPLWALGYQQSRYSYYPEPEVRRIAARLRSSASPPT